jgi:hypothetical protein
VEVPRKDCVHLVSTELTTEVEMGGSGFDEDIGSERIS